MEHSIQNKLILLFLGNGSVEEKTAQLRRLSETGWIQLLELPAWYCITPLLYDRLNIFSSTCNIPPEMMQKLRDAYLANTVRNMCIYHELKQVLKSLQGADIPVIVLKGAHLAQTVYGNIALRTMGDLDLLVNKCDLERTIEELQKLGYSADGCDDIETHCQGQKHLPPFVRSGATRVEIHWTFVPPTSHIKIDTQGLWERASSATIAGVETLVLNPEDLLLHLCLHAGFTHGFLFSGLRALCDVSATIQCFQDEMQWDQFRLRALEWGIAKSVHMTLWLTRELLDAPVPEDLIGSLKPKDFDSRWVSLAKEAIFAQEHITSKKQLRSYNLAELFSSKPLSDKLRTLLRAIFHSPQNKIILAKHKIPANSFGFFFCYLLRATEIFLRHAPSALRLIVRDRETVLSAKLINKQIELRDWLISE